MECQQQRRLLTTDRLTTCNYTTMSRCTVPPHRTSWLWPPRQVRSGGVFYDQTWSTVDWHVTWFTTTHTQIWETDSKLHYSDGLLRNFDSKIDTKNVNDFHSDFSYCMCTKLSEMIAYTMRPKSYLRSQCSTVVRNTVVRATIKVNGKFQILGTRSPQPLNQST